MLESYKVGFINRKSTLDDRIKELENAQCVIPGSLRIEAFVPTKKAFELERSMHNDPDLIASTIHKNENGLRMISTTL